MIGSHFFRARHATPYLQGRKTARLKSAEKSLKTISLAKFFK
jgi:hypothetical protein